MIRSLKTVRREIRSLCCDTCPIIPGRPGPIEPFDAKCLGETAEVWETIDNYFARAFAWDMGGQDGRKFSPADTDDAVALARWILFTTPPAQWLAMGIGYGDRMRALHAVRGRLKKMHWRDRFANHGGRKASRRYRAYKASMSVSLPSPAVIAMAVESAAVNGVKGATVARGRPKMETKIVSPAVARAAIVGEPMAEVVMEGVCVSGGVANIETDGRMKPVNVSTVHFTFFTGKRVAGKWIPDGGQQQLTETETRYRMVPGKTRAEYPRTFVARALDAGTEKDRHVQSPLPAAEPWNAEQRGHRTTSRETVRGQTVAANVEAYREALAEYYSGK